MYTMILGYSKSGKTTYMATLYNILANGMHGFSVKAKKNDDHVSLLSLGKKIKQGEYPKSTDMRQEYSFDLKYNGSNIIPFSWLDYRGGALSVHTNIDKDIPYIIEKIKNADALIVFLDGDTMIKESSALVEQCRQICILVGMAVSKIDKDTFYPISFVFTKGDIYGSSQLLLSPGMEKILPLLEMIHTSKNIGGLVTVTEINQNSLNVHYPFFFSMVHGIQHQIENIRKEIKEKWEKAIDYQKKSNFLDDIISPIFSGSSYSSRALDYLRECQRQCESLESLEQHLDNIVNMIKESQGESMFLL